MLPRICHGRVRNGGGTDMKLDDKVIAARDITEDGLFHPDTTHVHAHQGETGIVVSTNPESGFVLVQWDRTGTTCDCEPDEVRLQ